MKRPVRVGLATDLGAGTSFSMLQTLNEAYKAANPGNTELAKWLDAQLATFDKIYGGKRPRYIDGYNQLKAAIKPWGSK